MTFILIFKLVVVVLALLMFLRRPNFVWGIGLLSVTTAVLLDTILGTFNRELLLAELGFFFYIIAGVLFAGATLWAWGVLRPVAGTAVASAKPVNPSREVIKTNLQESNAAFDRQMLYEEIRQRLGREDIFDLIFDLGLNESDVLTLDHDMNQLIINIMDYAEENGQSAVLALAVERILTPPPPEILPRLEKIDADSPATILRHYLIAHYNLEALQKITADLGIDWEQLAGDTKQTRVRSLLLYLYRRNRINELIDQLHKSNSIVTEEAE